MRRYQRVTQWKMYNTAFKRLYLIFGNMAKPNYEKICVFVFVSSERQGPEQPLN